MNKTNVAIAMVAFLWLAIPVNAQFGKLKDKISGGKSGGGSFAEFNEEKDEMGITGEYHSLTDKRSYGMRFVKEQDGKIVNKLQYFEKKGKEPQLELSMKESYFLKNKVKLS